MTSMPDLNITGSPIYEDLVAITGDPYQPPAYQLPDVYGGGLVAVPPRALPDTTGSFPAIPSTVSMQAAPEAVTQWLGQFLGHGNGSGIGNGNWFAVLVFGGAAADQFRHMSPVSQFQQYQPAGNSGYDAWTQYTPEQMYQAYQWYAAQQQAQAALEARTPAALPAAPEPMAAAAQYFQPQQQPPAALPVPVTVQQAAVPMQAQPMPVQQMQMQQVQQMQQMPVQQVQQLPVQQVQMPYGAEPTQQFGGMLTQDWADWLGRASQTVNGPMEEVGAPGYPEERRGGIGGRFGAALRELRGR